MSTAVAQRKEPLFTRQSLVRLIIPLVIEQFLLMSVGMADTVMVTSAGEAAVSGVSLVDNINILLIQIFAALATGGAVIVSQYFGRREMDGAKSASKQLLYTVVVVSTVLMVLALLFRRQILSLLFGQIEADVMDSAMDYFLTTALAYPFISIYNAGAALFRSVGNSKVSMFNSLIVNIVNIVVNAVLIYGFQMGAMGAGIGTLTSRIVAAVVILIMVQKKDCILHIPHLFRPEFHGWVVKKILMLGIPNGLESGLFQVGKLLVLNLIASFGTNAVAANAIGNSICGVINVPGQAIGLALITVVGQCMGAGEPDQAASFTNKLLGVTHLTMGIMCVIVFFAADLIVGLFGLSEQSAAMAVEIMRWYTVFTIVFWPVSFTLPNALRAAGDVVFTMVVALVSMFLCRIGLSYFLGMDWGMGLGLLGVWIAMFLDWILRDVFFLFRYLRGKWKRLQVI